MIQFHLINNDTKSPMLHLLIRNYCGHIKDNISTELLPSLSFPANLSISVLALLDLSRIINFPIYKLYYLYCEY